MQTKRRRLWKTVTKLSIQNPRIAGLYSRIVSFIHRETYSKRLRSGFSPQGSENEPRGSWSEGEEEGGHIRDRLRKAGGG